MLFSIFEQNEIGLEIALPKDFRLIIIFCYWNEYFISP